MKQEELQKALESITKGGIHVAGDFVMEKHVEHEVANVEAGGIGIQIVNGSNEVPLTITDKEIKEALVKLQEETDETGKPLWHDLDQWYAVFRVLSKFCGYPSKPKEFEKTMKNLGADDLRLPCKYDNFRKVTLHQLPQNVGLWIQYKNSADQYSMKQLKVALKLMEILHID